MEINMEKLLFIINEILIKDVVLQLVIVVSLVVFIIQLIKHIKNNRGNKFISYSNIDNLFYKFFKLHFIFILIFLLNISFLLGVLNANILECLASKYILALTFFFWSIVIYFIDIIVYNYYIRLSSNDNNVNLNMNKQIYKSKVDFVWTSIKLIISILFMIYFTIGLYLDIINLFI